MNLKFCWFSVANFGLILFFSIFNTWFHLWYPDKGLAYQKSMLSIESDSIMVEVWYFNCLTTCFHHSRYLFISAMLCFKGRAKSKMEKADFRAETRWVVTWIFQALTRYKIDKKKRVDWELNKVIKWTVCFESVLHEWQASFLWWCYIADPLPPLQTYPPPPRKICDGTEKPLQTFPHCRSSLIIFQPL